MNPNLRKNDTPEFVGLEALKRKHHAQYQAFEEWAKVGKWQSFHQSHYDWWAFPYEDPSGAYAFAYSIWEYETEILQQDALFMTEFIRGAVLLMLSWGWDLQQQNFIQNPEKHQVWQNWAIRLYKCARALKQLGFEKEFQSVRKFALFWIEKGSDFTFYGKDLTYLFR